MLLCPLKVCLGVTSGFNAIGKLGSRRPQPALGERLELHKLTLLGIQLTGAVAVR